MGTKSRSHLALLAAMACVSTEVAHAQEEGDLRGFQASLATVTPEVERCSKGEELQEAERKRRASEHFNRGRELYEQGGYEQAITEFASAYCHIPHPATLKNIAQSFERLVQYERAVSYLKRYIIELGKTDAQESERTGFRVQVLENLPARVRVASLPRGATVTLFTDSGPVAKAVANSDEPLLVRRGHYKMRVELAGFEPVEQAIDPEIGQPYSYYFRLEPKKGVLRVSASPKDARIFIDRRLVGLGTYVAPLPIGSYELMVEKRNRVTERRRVELKAGETRNETVLLGAPPRSGRTELLVASSTFGGLIGGSAFASAFETDTRVAGIGAAAGLGVGLLGGYFGVPERIPVGQSSAIIGSTLWAATEGLVLTALFTCDETTNASGAAEESCAESRTFFAIGTLAGVGGLVASSLLAPRYEPSAGDAALLNSGGLWGLATGALLWSAFEEEQKARDPLLLVGLNMGLLTGGLIASRLELSRGRVSLIDLGGLGGILVGVATAELSSEAQTGVDHADHFALVGLGAGLITAGILTRGMGETTTPNLRAHAQPIRDSSGTTTIGIGASAEF